VYLFICLSVYLFNRVYVICISFSDSAVNFEILNTYNFGLIVIGIGLPSSILQQIFIGKAKIRIFGNNYMIQHFYVQCFSGEF